MCVCLCFVQGMGDCIGMYVHHKPKQIVAGSFSLCLFSCCIGNTKSQLIHQQMQQHNILFGLSNVGLSRNPVLTDLAKYRFGCCLCV